MAEPWFDPNTFGVWLGGLGGGVGGTLCGLWGAACGMLAPRGIGRTWILGFGWLMVAVGVGCLGFGLYALAMGQPWNIWLWPCHIGLIVSGVVGGLIPVIRKRYAEAESRRLQAEEFRAR